MFVEFDLFDYFIVHFVYTIKLLFCVVNHMMELNCVVSGAAALTKLLRCCVSGEVLFLCGGHLF